MFSHIKVMLYCYSSSWVLAIQTSWLSFLCCFQNCDWNSECRFCIMVCPIMYLSTPTCQELMKLLGSHGSFSLPFVMKVMVWCFFWATFFTRLWLHLLLCLHSKCLLWRFLHNQIWDSYFEDSMLKNKINF